MKDVLHIVSSLVRAGAENIVYELVKFSPDDIDSTVISLAGEGYFAKYIRLCGAKVYGINMRKINNIFRFIYLINAVKRDAIYLHMYHSMLLGEFFDLRHLKTKKIWCFHHESPRSMSIKGVTAFIVYILMLISKIRKPKAVFLSKKAYEYHCDFGFSFSEIKIINNGVDLERFRIDIDTRDQVRRTNDLEKTFVIGNVARWNPIKNHEFLFKIVSRLTFSNFKLILSGVDMDYKNPDLARLIKKYELEDKVILFGERDDIHELMCSFDLHILTSKMEGFGLVTAEAMACGVPCLSTDVGCQREIISSFGFVGSELEPDCFIEYISKIYSMASIEKEKLSYQSRNHIEKFYNTRNMARDYITFA